MVLRTAGGTHIQGNGLLRTGERVVYEDVRVLASEGLLDLDYMTNGAGLNVAVSPYGRQVYEELMTSSGDQVAEIEGHVWRYFDAPEFQQAFPSTYAKWND